MLGETFVLVGFFAALSAAFFYCMAMRRKSERTLRVARSSYLLAALAQLTASNVLLYLILTHQFQYTYVWSYSSTTLPLPLLASTFYAGQEGSFMLWTLFLSLLGVVLLRYTAKRDYEPSVMAVFSFILSFLFLMLVVKNPFTYIWETFPTDIIQQGAVPAGTFHMIWLDQAKGIWARLPVEGRGLNPLLQNYWMVIHPQILFLGFSSMTIPYAFAVGGLLKKEYTSWTRHAAPWAVFGALVLGTGIILGGYWAYETLGWGGFWGWDPVENSSLIPWLVCVASIHTMVAQRHSGAFVRTNFVLSMLSFMLVLYSTFLTRSGVLGDTSVHSFVDPGKWAYWLLIGFIIVFAILGFGLFFRRLREMPTISVQHSFFSREYLLFLGATALTSVAILVAVGTSSPLITSILQSKPSAIDMSYYVKTNLPLGVIITFLSGLAQLLWWNNTKTKPLLKQIAVPAILALLLTVFVLLMGRESFLIHLFVYCASFSLFANLQVIYEIVRGSPRLAGGAIAHIGIALMCIGFVTSAQYSEKKTVSLEQDKPMDLLGYRMTYRGFHQRDDGKYAFTVEVEQEGRKYAAIPTMYFSEQTQNVIRNPDIINFLRRDVYIEPLMLEDTSVNEEQQVELQKEKSQEYEGLRLMFTGFDFPERQRAAMMEGKPFEIHAFLRVSDGKKESTILMKIGDIQERAAFLPVVYQTTDHRHYEFTLTRIVPPQGDSVKAAIKITVQRFKNQTGQKKNETLTIEATIKPYINLVWIGTVVLVFGFLFTLMRRFSTTKLQQ
jgi:Cytochrome c biogenesis factor